ncbi:MAG: histidine kinase, partial [Clostridia bacterium]|nr:histidine kinase [Clostridia bacterium]
MPVSKGSMIKNLIFVGIMILSIMFESASFQRLTSILILSLVFLCISLLKANFRFKNPSLMLIFALIEIMLVFLLEVQSRYLINYFLMMIYILSIVENAYLFKLKETVILQVIALIVANYKYIVLLRLDGNFKNMTQFIFFLIINLLIATAVDMAIVYKREKLKTEQLNNELVLYQEKLSDMATTEERNRIARELHDSLGHELSALIMEMEIVNHLFEKNQGEAKKRLSNSLNNARNSLSKVREVVETLNSEDINIHHLLERFQQRTNINIDYKGISLENESEPVKKSLFRIIQESLTNSLKHG